jgi:hypothetical protein
MRTQAEKAAVFRALHERARAFIIPNPWEAGTAKLLAGLGFETLATTSLGLANMLGCADSKVTREEAIANRRVIAEATDLPVNARMNRKPRQRLSGSRQRPVSLAAPSRITPATPPIRSTISISPLLVFAPRRRSHMPCRYRFC